MYNIELIGQSSRDVVISSTYIMDVATIRCTVEPLYSGHHWDHSKCPDFRGFLISGVDLYTFVCICGKTKCSDLRVSGVRGFTVVAPSVLIARLTCLGLTSL